jgi:lysophospholipase L1-like esterase
LVTESKSTGATPVLLSLTAGSGVREFAKGEGLAFIDLAGRKPTAKNIVAGLKALRQNALIRWLSRTGRAIPNAVPESVQVSNLPLPPPGRSQETWFRWLNLPEVADPSLPSLILIGDSTVRNGRGDGVDGQWGWGDPLAAYFDPARINVVNRAVGGTGSRSFLSSYWDLALPMIKPGDVVIMQFGHNDNGARGPLRGIGEETELRGAETIHTYGWYLRRYISDIRAKGATPIVCSLVPRNIWEGGKIARPRDSHADWARDVAQAEGVGFLDLHERIAQRYDPMGEEAVTALFADKRTHTGRAGAEMSAAIVVSALRALPQNPVAKYLQAKPAPVW